MNHEMFAIYDAAAGCYRSPMHMKSAGLAIRAFTDAVNAKDNELSAHPEDFTLFRVGTFDDDTGEVTAFKPTPMKVMTALEVVAQRGDDHPDLFPQPGGSNNA